MAAVSDIFNQLGIVFDQGVIKIRSLAVEFLQIRKLAIDVTPDDTAGTELRRDPTIGSAQFNPGETAIYIANNQVSTSSKIFITPERPVALGLCLKNQATSTVDGLIQPPGFKVCLNQPAGETIKFDWWIVDVVDNSQQATSPQPSPLQGEGAGEVSPSALPAITPSGAEVGSPNPEPSPSAEPTSPQPSPLQGEGEGEVSPILSPEPSETPTPSVTPSPEPSSEPLPSPESSPTSEPSPSPEPTPSLPAIAPLGAEAGETPLP
jgi:hypothetical protein